MVTVGNICKINWQGKKKKKKPGDYHWTTDDRSWSRIDRMGWIHRFYRNRQYRIEGMVKMEWNNVKKKPVWNKHQGNGFEEEKYIPVVNLGYTGIEGTFSQERSPAYWL